LVKHIRLYEFAKITFSTPPGKMDRPMLNNSSSAYNEIN